MFSLRGGARLSKQRAILFAVSGTLQVSW